MNEHEPRPAHRAETPDWRNLTAAAKHFTNRVTSGITAALAQNREIDDQTARTIAEVLGHAYGPSSHLAGFARTGDVQYESLRDEYLPLYNAQQIDTTTKEMIDWLGTYLVQRENISSGHRYMNEQLLITTSLQLQGERFTIHIPASADSGTIDELTETLTQLRLPEDEALQAFLSLPDVNVLSGDIMGSFGEAFVGSWNYLEDAVRELAELGALEDDLRLFTDEHGLPEEAVTIDYEVIEDRVREAYDIVEKRRQIHVFNK
jgi:hypothetical protein